MKPAAPEPDDVALLLAVARRDVAAFANREPHPPKQPSANALLP